jgi:hypothetical protein
VSDRKCRRSSVWIRDLCAQKRLQSALGRGTILFTDTNLPSNNETIKATLFVLITSSVIILSVKCFLGNKVENLQGRNGKGYGRMILEKKRHPHHETIPLQSIPSVLAFVS